MRTAPVPEARRRRRFAFRRPMPARRYGTIENEANPTPLPGPAGSVPRRMLGITERPPSSWPGAALPLCTQRYYYGTRVASEWQVGSPVTYSYPDGKVAAEGEVLEVDPPKRLLMTFHALWDPEAINDPPIRHLWEIEPEDDGTCRLRVISFDLVPGSKRATEFGDGIAYIVSGLKSLVETGQPLVTA